MGLTVTQLATPSVVRIHHCPPTNLRFTIYDFGFKSTIRTPKSQIETAEVAQSIEHQPSKLRVAGLSPVFRSDELKIRAQGQKIGRYFSREFPFQAHFAYVAQWQSTSLVRKRSRVQLPPSAQIMINLRHEICSVLNLCYLTEDRKFNILLN